MAAPVATPARSAVCFGDPDTFSAEMIKMINDKDFRFAKPPCHAKSCSCFFCLYALYVLCSDIRFVVGEERRTIYAHKCLLAARFVVS